MGSQLLQRAQSTLLPWQVAILVLLTFKLEIPKVLDPPTPDQGVRRIWSDSHGCAWFSEWNSGKLGLYDPVTKSWHEWRLPGTNPQPYAVFVDDKDMVWLSDFASNALVRFDPSQERVQVFPLLTPGANVLQLLGRPSEVWGAESAVDKSVLIRTDD